MKTLHERRGAVLIYAMIAMTALTGIASLAVDFGHVQMVRSQLQAAADAAARYAVIGYETDVTTARNYAATAAARNYADGSAVTLDTSADVEFGTWDSTNHVFTALTGSAQSGADAIRVTARRTAATNNPVQLSFGGLIGKSSCDVHAQAVAVSTTYGYGIVGLTSLTTMKNGASGNRSINIDSYNAVNSTYTSFPMSSNGNCASNGNITLGSGTTIKGNCQPGTGKSVSNPSYVSGSTTPLNYTLAFPAPTPGTYATTNDNANLGSKYFSASTRNYSLSNVTLTLPGGTYYVNNVSWSTPHLTFTGPAVFYITGTFTSHNMYITTYQNLPKNLKLLVTTSASVLIDNDQSCNLVVYAPLSAVQTEGLADDFGSIIGGSLTLTTGWHVDESLGGAGYTGKVWLVQ